MVYVERHKYRAAAEGEEAEALPRGVPVHGVSAVMHRRYVGNSHMYHAARDELKGPSCLGTDESQDNDWILGGTVMHMKAVEAEQLLKAQEVAEAFVAYADVGVDARVHGTAVAAGWGAHLAVDAVRLGCMAEVQFHSFQVQLGHAVAVSTRALVAGSPSLRRGHSALNAQLIDQDATAQTRRAARA